MNGDLAHNHRPLAGCLSSVQQPSLSWWKSALRRSRRSAPMLLKSFIVFANSNLATCTTQETRLTCSSHNKRAAVCCYSSSEAELADNVWLSAIPMAAQIAHVLTLTTLPCRRMISMLADCHNYNAVFHLPHIYISCLCFCVKPEIGCFGNSETKVCLCACAESPQLPLRFLGCLQAFKRLTSP